MSPNFSLTGQLRASDGEPAGVNAADTPSHQAATAQALDQLAVPAGDRSDTMGAVTPSAAGEFAAARITIAQSNGQFMPPAEHPEVTAYRQRWGK